MEASKTGFETNFVSSLFKYYFLTFIFFISVIELRNLKKNPKCLSIELFTKVGIQQLGKFVVFSDCQEG